LQLPQLPKQTVIALIFEGHTMQVLNKEVNKGEMLQWVTFKLDTKTYGVPVSKVFEIIMLTDLTPVPGSPIDILGVLTLQGEIISVLDIRPKLGLKTTQSTHTSRIIIVDQNSQQVGILVESVAEVVAYNSAYIVSSLQVDGTTPNQLFTGVINQNNNLLTLLNLDKLIQQYK